MFSCAVRRTQRSSMKAKMPEVAHSLAVTSGIPLIPGANRGFSPDPPYSVSHEEETSSMVTSSSGHKLEVPSEQAINKASLQKELGSVPKSHGNCFNV